MPALLSSAPTGSGKTVIGNMLSRLSLRDGECFILPLKALSNQKLRDLSALGLIWLVFDWRCIDQPGSPDPGNDHRNFPHMLYGTIKVGTSLVDVEAVVLDECHYMNDQQRGTVWEESIIYRPAEIQLVALSATITVTN